MPPGIDRERVDDFMQAHVYPAEAEYEEFVQDPARQISPETAGLSAFGMAFAGMFFGSLAGRMAGIGTAVRATEVDR